MELTYFTSGGSGDAGDQYTGLDRFGRIVDQRWRKTSDNTDRERVKYGYDRASNRQWRQNTVAGTGQDEYYTYDGLSQVKTLDRGTLNGTFTGITGTPSWEEDWNYDPSGNWRGSSTGYLTKTNGSTDLNQNRTHNVVNEVTNITETVGPAWPTPTFNAPGNMTLAPRPLSLANAYEFKYDAWNRLIEIKVPGGVVLSAHQYDGASRRVTKTSGGVIRHYYYSDQWQVLEERTGTSESAERWFVWGVRSIDDLVRRERDSEPLYVLGDALNVTAVINASGIVQERYGYTGFGTVRYLNASFGSIGNSGKNWDTLFGSYRYDTESGLYQVRYRFLHPALGRWITRDPLFDGSFNVILKYNKSINDMFISSEYYLYSYSGNQPNKLLDPHGLLVLIPPWLPTPECIGTLNDARLAIKQPSDGRSDDWLHCLWSCRITNDCGEDTARVVGDLKEWRNWRNWPIIGPDRPDSIDDQAANEAGRACGCSMGSSCENCCSGMGYR